MRDAGACGHQLNVAGREGSLVAHAVAMSELSGDHVGKNFHVPVRVGREATQRSHLVLIDDPQGAEARVGWIVVFRKREAVPAFKPAMVRVASIIGASDSQSCVRFHGCNHVMTFRKRSCRVLGLSMTLAHAGKIGG